MFIITLRMESQLKKEAREGGMEGEKHRNESSLIALSAAEKASHKLIDEKSSNCNEWQ